MAEEIKEPEAPKEAESWIQKKWRPMMAMMYMCVCACDFIVFPIMWTIVQFWETQAANDAFRQWQPLTLQGGGLFHMAMGAVLGISAWSRGQEKIAGANTPTIVPPPTPAPAPTGFNGTSQEDLAPKTPPVATGFNGKLAPPQPPQPLL